MNEPIWVVLARVEDGDSFFGEDAITPDILRRMAEVYDAEFRQAPVIAGYDPEGGASGGSHWQGQWLPPLGFIKGLEFDGLNLWGLVEELEDDGEGRVTKLVTDGFYQRSIGWWEKLPELKGRPPYLRHVALLGGENPGIPNMPPLTDYFVAAQGEQLGRIVAGASYCVRHLLNTQRPAAPAPTQDPKEDEMDQEQIRTLFQSEREAMTRSIGEAVAGQIRESLTGAIEPVVQGALEPLTQRIGALETLVTEQRANALQEETTRRFDALVAAGRVTPAQRKSEEDFLRGLPAEKIRMRLTQLEAQSPINPARLRDESPAVIGEGDDRVTVPSKRFTLPNGNGRVDPTDLQGWAEARRRSQGDPTKFRQAAYALAGEAVEEV